MNKWRSISANLLCIVAAIGSCAISADAQSHSVALSFDKSVTPNTTTNVKRSTTSGSGYAVLANTVGTSYLDSNVQAGATYFYVVSAVDAAGNESANSAEVSGTIPGATPPPPPACAVIPVNSWQNTAVSTQTGQFTATFDATPSSATMDSVIGLAPAAATGFTSLGPIVWFSNTGTIQARNAGSYTASASFRYSANTAYHFRLSVNVATHTYSAWVHTTGAETQIANNFAFRTEQNTATSLGFFAAFVNSGTPTIQVCNFALTVTPPPPPPPPPPTLTITCSGLTCTLNPQNIASGTAINVSASSSGLSSSTTTHVP